MLNHMPASRASLLIGLMLLSITLPAWCTPVMVKALPVEVDLFSIMLLQNETTDVIFTGDDAPALIVRNPRVKRSSQQHWVVQAGRASETHHWYDRQGEKRFSLNVLVMEPTGKTLKEGKIGKFLMGGYPPAHSDKPEVYRPPRGFLRVSPRLVDRPLSSHFTLRPFLSKQKGGFPKYVYLDERLLNLLEHFLADVKKQGYDINTFAFISGFRTPFYNQQLNNIVYSRHIYGDAADIYIDADQDNRIDDLNRDGQINASDVKFMVGLAERFKQRFRAAYFVGGIGEYPPTKLHTGFIHLDARGYPARW